jgi:hypothetical protein
VVSHPCRYCGTAYTTCVDGDPCCQACLHTDGHVAGRAQSCCELAHARSLLTDVRPCEADDQAHPHKDGRCQYPAEAFARCAHEASAAAREADRG